MRISIHAPRTGSDLYCQIKKEAMTIFQSTLPARGATAVFNRFRGYIRDFNPRSPHGERRLDIAGFAGGGAISIHAPRTGSDIIISHDGAFRNISIHAPRTGSDMAIANTPPMCKKFQSTLPARGATLGRTCFSIQRSAFQSTLPARGATLRETLIDGGVIKFQSTLPARGATILIGLLSSAWYFNPRSPHGERLASDADVRHFAHISIHAPRTGSDRRVAYTINRQTGISIHAPRTGSDNLRVAREAVERHDFNPRSPHGERRAPPMTSVSPPSVFQSTLPARGATDASHSSMRRFRFQSTLPARGATL